MSGPHVGELAALATALLWTLSALAWTAAGRRVGAVAVGFIRLIIATGLMMLYGWAAKGLWLPTDADARTWIVLGISGFLGFFVADVCLLKAFLLIGPRLSLLIGSLTPPLTAVLSSACIGDRLSAWDWIAMAVTLAGVVWVVCERPYGHDHPQSRRRRGQGFALATISSVLMAASYVLAKEGLGDCDVVAATLIRILWALPGYAVIITLRHRWPAMLATVRHRRVMATLTFGAIVGPFFGVAFNMIALRHSSAGVVATIVSTMPVLILPFSIFLHHERVSLRAVAGALVAVAGVALLML